MGSVWARNSCTSVIPMNTVMTVLYVHEVISFICRLQYMELLKLINKFLTLIKHDLTLYVNGIKLTLSSCADVENADLSFILLL